MPLPADDADAPSEHQLGRGRRVVGKRPVDFDMLVVEATLTRIAAVVARSPQHRRTVFSINLLPAASSRPISRLRHWPIGCGRIGLSPRHIVIECTERQPSPTCRA